MRTVQGPLTLVEHDIIESRKCDRTPVSLPLLPVTCFYFFGHVIHDPEILEVLVKSRLWDIPITFTCRYQLFNGNRDMLNTVIHLNITAAHMLAAA
jgi:hypothetical protein